MHRFAVLLLITLAACGNPNAPIDAPKDATAAAVPAPMPPEPKGFPLPDACSLLTAANVTTLTGWKAPKFVPVDTKAEYLSACRIVDAAQETRFVKVAVALGSASPTDSAEYALTVGDAMGTLKAPAVPVRSYGVPAIEMDGGPDKQSVQARLPQFVELTVTTSSMNVSRSLFGPALLALRSKLPAP